MEPPFTQAFPRYSDEDNHPQLQQHPLIPPPDDVRRPSDGWLRKPAWIDGALDPPRFYHSHEEIEVACIAHGVDPPPRYRDGENAELPRNNGVYAPTLPLPISTQYDVLSSRVSPTPVPSQSYHYRDHVGLAIEAVQPTVSHSQVVQVEQGHLVNVTHIFTPSELPAAGPLNRNSKALPKKKKTTMLGHIVLKGITRAEFIKAFLMIHSLHNHFAPGIHSGPEFKLSWTGSAGGKGGAPTILNDQSFNIALTTILQKDKGKIQVTVEFNTDTMSGFHIEQPNALKEPSGNSAGDEELMYGNKVSYLS